MLPNFISPKMSVDKNKSIQEKQQQQGHITQLAIGQAIHGYHFQCSRFFIMYHSQQLLN